ncbi:MAG: GvpL/GvpF family gas vesicle protein [Candidatus Zixiibacteriota bacterium]
MKDQDKGFELLFPQLADKEKWEVKIYADFRRMKDCISKTKPEAKQEQSVQEELNKRLAEYKQTSFGWMCKQALDAKLDEIPLQEPDRRRKALILKSTFWVLKESRDNFTRVVRCIWKEYKSKGMDFECTGPQPPDDLLAEN